MSASRTLPSLLPHLHEFCLVSVELDDVPADAFIEALSKLRQQPVLAAGDLADALFLLFGHLSFEAQVPHCCSRCTHAAPAGPELPLPCRKTAPTKTKSPALPPGTGPRNRQSRATVHLPCTLYHSYTSANDEALTDAARPPCPGSPLRHVALMPFSKSSGSRPPCTR